jgi:hypothetical protein
MYGNVRVGSSVTRRLRPLISFRPWLKLGPPAPGRSELRRRKYPPSGPRRIGLLTGFLDIGFLDLCLAQRFTGRRVDDRVLFVTSFVRPLRNGRCVSLVWHPGLQLKTRSAWRMHRAGNGQTANKKSQPNVLLGCDSCYVLRTVSNTVHCFAGYGNTGAG